MISFGNIDALYEEYTFQKAWGWWLNKLQLDALWKRYGMEYGRWYSEQDIDSFWIHVYECESYWNEG